MTEAAVGEPDRCPRCAGHFTCGAAGPAPCDCFTLKIDPEVLAALRERYVGCLCLACLHELAVPPVSGPA
ncbi:MAG: cysteine-rich CWC family protein [Methyloversatilis sp.]|uniref:cysteine-rich CWC family protein n=1 Tax=Methyloversatilis sp. TaxID=2569862 RepID=UPI00273548E1|nr:cysteine-rich CWC family protein [Methyloversatilis sp.]MDP3872385.1 cysteine-rich CWC family protein [Methyloversatilis sp.]